MPDSPAADGAMAAAGEVCEDGMPADSAPAGLAPADAPGKAARRSRARKVRERPSEPEPVETVRPLMASPPLSMPAAPGVPAAIFQAPA